MAVPIFDMRASASSEQASERSGPAQIDGAQRGVNQATHPGHTGRVMRRTGSRPLYNRVEFSGLGGNWMERTALQRTGVDPLDQSRNVAKVRVAGSNPVVRSR